MRNKEKSYKYKKIKKLQKRYTTKMNKKKISIIIPVYNVEEYIRQCLDSVVNQTYREIEIILVDD